MTALILARRRILSRISIPSLALRIEEHFSALNGRGLATGLLLFLIAAGAVLYLSMIMLTFDAGIRLQEVTREKTRQEKELQKMEVQARVEEAQFTARHRDILEKMGKISSVRYLTPDGVAVSQAPHPTALR